MSGGIRYSRRHFSDYSPPAHLASPLKGEVGDLSWRGREGMVAANPGAGNYLQRMWNLRFFLFSLVGMDLRARYKRSMFGFFWSLIRPLSMTAIFCVVFCPLFNLGV